MKLIAVWGVHSPRFDRLREARCSHCGDAVGRLVRHDAGAGGTQIWLSCARCCARLGNALPHREHPRLASYPLWSEDLGEEPTREEVVEIGLSARPVALTELLAKIPCVPALERVGRAEHITVGYDISEGDIAALARVIPAGEYAVLEFRDAGARLLRFERDLIKVLTPHRTGARLDLSDVSILRLKCREPAR